MLAPSKDSFRRSGASLNGSRVSLSSLGSKTSRHTSLSNNYGSQFSLRRSSLQNGSARSSMQSLRHEESQRQLSQGRGQGASNHNAVWNIEDPVNPPHSLRLRDQGRSNAVWDINDSGSVSRGPPSLTSSINSESTARSSQSSLQSPSLQTPANDTRNEVLQRFYALNKASLKKQANTRKESPQSYDLRRPQLKHHSILHPTNSLSISRRHSFLPSAQIKEEDAWGHFVETKEAEEDLARRSKLLSVTKAYPASFSHSYPTQLR